MGLRCVWLLFLVIGGNLLPAQDTLSQRIHTATRLDSKLAIKVDADLSDDAWQSAAIATDFVQFEPYPGEPASYNSEVKIIYDDEALYVGALLLDPEPDKILRQLSVRDDRDNTSWFGVTIDPYRQTQLGFAFIVSAAGVQQDILLTSQGEDANWNAVWDSAVKITDEGWVVEMKIPYSAIRFPDQPVQEWGIQFAREIRRYRESTFWNPVLPTVNGFLTQFGKLEGIKDITPPLRLQFTPFVIGYYDRANSPGIDPVGDAYYSGGMDVKYGINDAFTLDMTLIPDFGQARSDNNVLNLSPFEVFLEEQRQFFTEGVELFDKGGIFFSRRIGGAPINRRAAQSSLDTLETIIDNPTITRLYNASKVSGRTNGGLGIGVLNAVSAATNATIEQADGQLREVETSPLTNYNVIVLDQNLRANSSVTFSNTNVWRRGDTYDANVSSLGWDIKDKDQRYGVFGNYTLSQQYGDFDQRGARYSLGLSKISGNVTGEMGYYVETDTYDHNDLGFLRANNERQAYMQVNYNDFTPKWDKLQRWRYFLGSRYQSLYAPNKFTGMELQAGTFYLFQSRDAFGMDISVSPTRAYDYFEPRTADFSERVADRPFAAFTAFISSDYRKVFALDARYSRVNFHNSERYQETIRIAPRIRFSDRLFTTLSTTYTRRNRRPGYVNKVFAGPALQDLAGRVLVGERMRDQIESILNLEYIFTDVMSITGRIRHYWDRVQYQQFGWLNQDGFLDEIDYQGLDESDNPVYDRNINLFNVDVVYTWRFAPGSDIIAVWKNSISKVNDEYDRNYLDNIAALGEGNQFDSFSVRLIYFLDYLYLQRRG